MASERIFYVGANDGNDVWRLLTKGGEQLTQPTARRIIILLFLYDNTHITPLATTSRQRDTSLSVLWLFARLRHHLQPHLPLSSSLLDSTCLPVSPKVTEAGPLIGEPWYSPPRQHSRVNTFLRLQRPRSCSNDTTTKRCNKWHDWITRSPCVGSAYCICKVPWDRPAQ